MFEFNYSFINLSGHQNREVYNMVKEFNHDKIKEAVRLLIEAVGDNPEREGLKGTPDRVARMYDEVFEGMKYSNKEIAEMFDKCFESESNDLVVVDKIPIFSYCEHHLALMYNMEVTVAYIPKGKVIGLSKIARVADMVGKRLQLQERIGEDIAEIMTAILGTENVMVVIKGEHSCMTARGIKSRGSQTKTASLKGIFKTDSDLRSEVYSLTK